MLKLFIELMERGLLPDTFIRFGIRWLCAQRLKDLRANFHQESYIQNLANGPLAQNSKEANKQHYEVPTEFYLMVLGSQRKYSCAYFQTSETPLDQAELDALEITTSRAEIENGMHILELGCGWGSLSLFLARKFPQCKILSISNSATQREYIESQIRKENLTNLTIKTLDLSQEKKFSELPLGQFDRVVSVEMLEHFKNYKTLFRLISDRLKKDGKFFTHIFTHRTYSYPFETEGSDNWMGRYFFTGGQMPAHDLLLSFQEDLALEKKWEWNGLHYKLTAEWWLKNLDSHRLQVQKIFEGAYSKEEAQRWIERWRVFFLSCAELFGYQNGNQWNVSHYLFSLRRK